MPMQSSNLPAGEVAALAACPFRADNRAGVPGTLHRISAIRDRDRSVIGLTYRVGRSVAGRASTSPDTCSPEVSMATFMLTHGAMQRLTSQTLSHVEAGAGA